MRPSDRHIRITAGLLAVGGLAAISLALLADELGVGEGVASETFGWKQLSVLLGGFGVFASGAVLLARPRLPARLLGFVVRPLDVILARAATYVPNPKVRRWLTAGVLVTVFTLSAVVGYSWLSDRILPGDNGSVVPAPPASAAPPSKPSPQDRFRAAMTAVCERHQPRMHRLAKRGYASGPAARLRLLRANASAVSAVRGDLKRLVPTAEDAAAFSQLLTGLRRIAAHHRAVATAIASGDGERERAMTEAVLTATDAANAAAQGLGVPACGAD